ncbi:MAG: ribonuclease P protein component [Bacteroidales bacterium]
MKNQFKKSERLCSKKLIELLFTEGKSFLVYPVKITYLVRENAAVPPAQALILVSRKRFRKATRRNRMKRLLREAYRLEKNYFYENLNKLQKNALIAISYIADNEIYITEIRKSVALALKRIIDNYSHETIS